MTDKQDVIVIGGGAIGAACARELARVGHRVVVLERGTGSGEAWMAAAGMLAPQIEGAPDDPLFELGLAGRNRYRELAESLLETTGIDIGLRQDGIAQIALDEEAADQLKAKVAWQRQQGHLCDWLAAPEVEERWPWMGPTGGALWAAEEGAVDPQKLVEALRADAELSGARVVSDEVHTIEREGDRVVGVRGKKSYSAPIVVVAGGAWSRLLAGLPRPIPVEPIRGQMAALPWPAEIEPAIVYGADGYLVARSGEAIIGSTMENAGFNTEVTSTGLAKVFAAATTLCPALASVEVRRTWAGLRPVTPDGVPLVGTAVELEGLYIATGHGRNGILLAAITGLTIAQLISGEETTVEDLEALDPGRFWQW